MSRKTKKRVSLPAFKLSDIWFSICCPLLPFRLLLFGHSHEHSHSTSQSICTILTHANSKNTHSRTNHAEFVHGFTLNATQYYLKFKYFCELNFVLEKKNDSVLHKMHIVCWSINVIYALKQHQHNTKYLSFKFWLFHLFPSTRLYRNVWARFLLLANLYHWQYKM